MGGKRPLLARCAPRSHGALRLWAAEAKLDRAVEKAYLVLSWRGQRIVTAWTQRAPDGLLIWSSENEAWEFLVGPKVPEAVRAEVFVDAGADSPRPQLLGHFEVDLVMLAKSETVQRLESHLFISQDADRNACNVGKKKLTLQVSWAQRGSALRRRGKELDQLVQPLLEVEVPEVDAFELAFLDDLGPAEEVDMQKKGCRSCARKLRQDWDQLKEELSMQQWASRQLWQERGTAPEEVAPLLVPPQELLAEQLDAWRGRLHEVEKNHREMIRTRPKSPRLSTETPRRERHRLGRSRSEGLPSKGQASTQGSTREPSLRGTPSPASKGEDTLDVTAKGDREAASEVSRFLRQHRSLQARQLVRAIPSRPPAQLAREFREGVQERYATLTDALRAFAKSEGKVSFENFAEVASRVPLQAPLSEADLELLWRRLSNGQWILVRQLSEFLAA